MPQVLVIIYLFTNLIINLVPLFRKTLTLGTPRGGMAYEERMRSAADERAVLNLARKIKTILQTKDINNYLIPPKI